MRGDGTPRRAYLYAADLTIWLWTILMRGTPCRAYNVGSDEGIAIGELAALVPRALDTQTRITRQSERQSQNGHWRYVPSTQRAREELQLTPQVPLEEAIRRTAQWVTAREPARRVRKAEEVSHERV